MATATARPHPGEFATYYAQYIGHVEGDDVLTALEQSGHDAESFLSSIGEGRGELRYAPGKWTIKEVLGHVIDTERIFTYRALCISRGDQTPLPGFDQDVYVKTAGSNARTLASLAEEFAAVRQSALLLFKSLTPEAWARDGIAFEKHITVRALAYIVVGHQLHHFKILRERYLIA